MKVKICANTSIEEAQMCIDAGADIIGILVGQEHVSNDFVDKEKAKEICEYVNKRCDVSLVTHLTSADEIIKLTKYIGNNIIQLYSDIDESEVEKIKNELPNIELVRLIHVASDGTICTDYKKMIYVDYYLLDSFNLKTNQVGGTGLMHDWNKSGELIKLLNKPTFLAGGLNPDNVKTAIETAKPYGVDVNSGCKNEIGKKDREKVIKFVTNAKHNESKKIIFDLDNTLLFISDEWIDAYNFFIDKYNLNVSAKELYSTIGTIEKNNPDIYITKQFFIDYINDKLSLDFDEQKFDELLEIYAKIPLKNIEVVENILAYLSNKYELIAYTNWFTDNQILRLKINKIDNYFSKVLGWDVLPVKPSMKGLREIVGNNINNYMFIGDNIDMDIKLPVSIGIETIFYNRKGIFQDEYKEIRNIDELKGIL
ncbi:MAG: HAD hydrolase-like protein [Bacilli bacterium]|nr:HAD hydrolase-like protein [Bacilli bacterium]